MKWRLISLLLFVVSVILLFGFVVRTPQFVLVRKIKQLEAQNEKLHGDIRTIAAEVGGNGAIPKPYPSDRLLYREVYEDQLYYFSKPKVSRCETIHVAIMAAGYNTSRGVVTMLKSILFYRHNPIHFHFITDQIAQHILGTLFQTWKVPAVNVSFYGIEEAHRNVSWIPNFHYSGTYGLMKLTVTDILPSHLDKVVFLDTDLMFTADIAGLWQFFWHLREAHKLFGLVENQSDWYLGKLWEKHKPWPALGRGFNTGVMLLDLWRMREMGWHEMWKQVTVETLQMYRATALADQDIINAVIKEHTDIHYILPCAWNVQLSEHTLSEYCYRDAEDFKVIHWNSPRKLQVFNNHGLYFRNLYMGFQDYNGNLLLNELLSCNAFKDHEQPVHVESATDPCSDFRQEIQTVHRTHPFFVDFDYKSNDPSDVTLIAQLSMDRLQMLGPLFHHWEGPMSISVYASDPEANQFLEYIYSSDILGGRTNIGFHVVYKAGRFYPVNYLRNVALKNVRTPYVFLSDIDFRPMIGLYSYLKEAIRVLGMVGEKRTLVVPAFETLLYRFDFPENKTQLLRMFAGGMLYTFRYNVWPKGHAPTNYEHWKTATVPYKVTWAPDFEPYIAVSSNVTRYDTRFVGFGWNKVSHIMELESQAYEFVVLPDAFMVHMPHTPSLDITTFRSSRHYRDCMQVLKREFQRQLFEKYGTTTLEA